MANSAEIVKADARKRGNVEIVDGKDMLDNGLHSLSHSLFFRGEETFKRFEEAHTNSRILALAQQQHKVSTDRVRGCEAVTMALRDALRVNGFTHSRTVLLGGDGYLHPVSFNRGGFWESLGLFNSLSCC